MRRLFDRDRNGVVTYDEWRDFLLLFPLNTNISAVYGVIFSDPLVDIGESVIIPEGISLQQIGKYFVAGGIAGASSRTVTAPLDRLKVLLQVQSSKNPKYKGIINGFRTIYKESGITGFWRGNGINVLKIAPETAVKFFSYEQVKKWLNADSEQISIKMRLISGGLAGLTAQAAVYPLEVLKTRLITQEKRLGLVKTFTGILKKEGLVAFFQGIKPALLGVVPFAALDLSVFESLKRSYMNRRDRHPNALVTLACGTVSSAIAVTAVYPLSLVRTRYYLNIVSAKSDKCSCTLALQNLYQMEKSVGVTLHLGYTNHYSKHVFNGELIQERFIFFSTAIGSAVPSQQLN
ncbi:uncharacterized protein LOC135120485 [Zophobas morio]|uniref:uncharacterized protein LOC135120485 n=1 Tax=Zophobas morio TaxID=2755281 RepID=UPI003083AE80